MIATSLIVETVLAFFFKHWKPIVVGLAVVALVVTVKNAKERYDQNLIDKGWNAHVKVIEDQNIKAAAAARQKIVYIERKHDAIDNEIRAKAPGAVCGSLVDLVIDRLPGPNR